MNNLKFRRQFLFTAKKCSELKDWNIESLDTHYLYTHPDDEMTRLSQANLELILIGHVLDPKIPDHTTLDILENISDFVTINDISKKLYSLVGRFVLLIKKDDSYTFFHDACGLKLLFYTQYKEELYAASQPLLLKLVTDVQESINHKKYYASEYVKDNREHYMPAGISLYENVHQLVPNHYLDVSSFKQIRYWPIEPLKREGFESSLDEFSTLLKKTMLAANKKFKLAIPLTGGWDSRMILACCKEIHEDIWFFTLKIRNLTMKSNDLNIPTKLASKLGLKYEIIDCLKPLDENYLEIYKNNTDIPHIHDWGEMSYGMSKKYPSERIAVKGNCSEVGRCSSYYKRPLLEFEYQWKDLDFIQERILEWLEEVKTKEVNCGYNLHDLFYMEHRIGSWQARSQLESDIVQENFIPYNNRELLDIMLRIDPLYRCTTDNLLFKKAMENLWPEVLSEPINPPLTNNMLKRITKTILLKTGVLDNIKTIVAKYNNK